jgi:hypothetical protein
MVICTFFLLITDFLKSPSEIILRPYLTFAP